MSLLNLFLNGLLLIQTPATKIIDGYTNKLSAYPGDSIEIYLNSNFPEDNYNLKLYDLSGTVVSEVSMAVFPQQPSNENLFENGFGYKPTKKIIIPQLPSGIYLWNNQIPFVVKSRNAKLMVVYPSNTNNAYCNSGGKSLYGFNSSENKGAQKVSFLRPMPLPRHSEAFFRWLHHQRGQDIGYVSDLDLDDYNSFSKSKLIVIAGHSEYWTLQARKNFDRFVASGKNALILSGNTMWWQVRYNKTKDQLICYRDAKADPVKSNKLKTVTWCEPELSYPIFSSTGTDFRNAGYGLKKDKGWDGFKIINASPLLEATRLTPGDILFCPSDETDGAPILSMENEIPIVDYQKLAFKKIEIVGYDLVSRAGKDGIATWIVFKATDLSGTVINTATTDWCSSRGIGSNADIQKITDTMIRKLLNDENVFSIETTTSTIN